MLHHIGADEIRTIAQLSREAREAQDRLLDKAKIVKAKDERELATELAGTLASLDVSLNNAPLRALRERLAALPSEARHELLAVLWIGRGDYAANEWEEALIEAQRRSDAGDVDYIAERGPLHDYLIKGLYLLKQA